MLTAGATRCVKCGVSLPHVSSRKSRNPPSLHLDAPLDPGVRAGVESSSAWLACQSRPRGCSWHRRSGRVDAPKILESNPRVGRGDPRGAPDSPPAIAHRCDQPRLHLRGRARIDQARRSRPGQGSNSGRRARRAAFPRVSPPPARGTTLRLRPSAAAHAARPPAKCGSGMTASGGPKAESKHARCACRSSR
jgi:hypothetical protein